MKMVHPRRYETHHRNVAKEIEIILKQFGNSGDTPGFWCREYPYGNLLDCIARCEHSNYCQHGTPPLHKMFNPDGNNPWRGDMALRFLMDNRELGNVEDWLWLQHPESRDKHRKRST